nr:ceramide kinase-like isoform X2 [Procambarus clarkii]
MVPPAARMHLQGNFYILKKRCKVTLTDDGISWVPEGSPECYHHIRPAEILGCWLCPKASHSCCHYAHPTGVSPGVHPTPLAVARCKHSLGRRNEGLTVEYCQRGRGVEWRARAVALVHLAGDVVVAWYHAIWGLLHGLPQRPRRVLVVINPVGGRRHAHRIYSRKVAPLFSRAAVQTSVVQTEYRGHGRELVERNTGLDGLDGVVAVGGDGLVNELVMGLLLVSARKAGLDPHDPEVTLPPTHLKLGIIPGDSRCVDVAAVHRNGQLQNVATTMVSYGYFGDLLKTSEQWRKLGPTRYLVSGVLQFLRNRSYEGHLKMLTPENPLAQPYDTNTCGHECGVCDKAAMSPPTPGDWLQFNGRWSVVTSAVTSCACRLSPYGVSPAAHLGDGCMDLILVTGGSRCRILSYLFRTAYTGNAANLDHVNIHRVQEVHFTPKATGPKSSWNCDGEHLPEPSVRLKVHCQRLQLFSRGVEARTEDFSKPVGNAKSASL